ncbi:MAG: halocin C8-like domain-containing protein, partial [Archaeoglobaceae archaeon]
YFVTAVNVAPKDEKKFAPFADVIEIKSKAKLSEHYRILAEVLNEIRKQDETSWIWNKVKLELSYLSRVVEKNLAEFNVEGKGSAMIVDIDWNSLLCDACKWLVGGLCSGATSYGCWKGCGLLCARIPHPIGITACYFLCLALCEFIVAYKACNMTADEVCKRVRNVC